MSGLRALAHGRNIVCLSDRCTSSDAEKRVEQDFGVDRDSFIQHVVATGTGRSQNEVFLLSIEMKLEHV